MKFKTGSSEGSTVSIFYQDSTQFSNKVEWKEKTNRALVDTRIQIQKETFCHSLLGYILSVLYVLVSPCHSLVYDVLCFCSSVSPLCHVISSLSLLPVFFLSDPSLSPVVSPQSVQQPSILSSAPALYIQSPSPQIGIVISSPCISWLHLTFPRKLLPLR